MSETLERKQVRGDIAHIMIPSVLECVLQLLAGIILTAMVGRLTQSDIAAQGISNQTYHICFGMFYGFRTGVTVAVSRYFGVGERGKSRRTVEQAYLTGVPISVLFAVLIYLFPQYILRLFTDRPELIAAAVSYLRIVVFAIPFMAVIAFNASAFNGHGDTKTPMFIAVVLNVVNILVGYVLIFGVGDVDGWGIKGAAVATVASQVAGALLGLWLLYRPAGLFSLATHGKKFFSFDWGEIKKLYAIGVPAAAEKLLWQLSAIVMSNVILGYGEEYYAAYRLGLQAETLTELPSDSFVIATTTLTSRAIGKRDGKLFRSYYSEIVKIALVVGVVATATLCLIPVPFMKLLTDKAVLQQIGAGYVFIMGFAQVPQVMTKVLNGVIRSTGGTRVPMYFSIIGLWVVRIPLILLVGSYLHLHINFIWALIAMDMTSRMIMGLIYTKKKDVTHYVEREFPGEAAEKQADA